MTRPSKKHRSPEPPPHRRAVRGYARGEETKLRIIEAALELFGAHGFEQTSTRDIAARAGVNAPALQYYFDGKEGLYIACAQHMADRGRELMAPAVARAKAVLAQKADTDTLIECFWFMMECSTEAMLRTREVDAWMRFMTWEDLRKGESPSGAEAVLDKCFRQELNELTRQLIGRITGRKADDPQTRIRAVTLLGQITVFFKLRDKALAHVGWDELNESRLKALKAIVREQTVAALKAAAKR